MCISNQLPSYANAFGHRPQQGFRDLTSMFQSSVDQCFFFNPDEIAITKQTFNNIYGLYIY